MVDATYRAEIYHDVRRRFCCISRKTDSRSCREFAKSISPERSKIVTLSWRREEICAASPALWELFWSPNMHQHERCVVSCRAISPRYHAVKNALLHLFGRKPRGFAHDLLYALN